ncbi:methyltransferase RsmF C-terminal domain-like protein [Novipirellula artificiosorum]|uniref:methyltransferase RsmF C-terminal domain-like protein n=1 Tax=Novipirellula artificiosorum TaxID=2528016 RepID=UPI001E3C14EC|nr:SAM-dependent methyltransferase [Novipirellula artificiosorum]
MGDAKAIDVSDLAAALGKWTFSADELTELATSLRRRHSSILRLRPELVAASLELSLAPIEWYSFGYRPTDPLARPSRWLPFAAGDYYLQDAGSLLALAAAELDSQRWHPANLVCDLCAAPGGKASAVAEQLGPAGFLLANEPIRSRLPALVHNLARTGSDRFAISSRDPADLASELPGCFDLVLVDAPCSGQALLSRKRQSTTAMQSSQIEHSAARQRRILSSAKSLLRPGGRLVYSTCTFATAENEDQVNWMVDELGMTVDPVDRLQAYASDLAPASYRLWPHRHSCAGSFAASLRRGDEAVERRTYRTQPSVKVERDLRQWFDFSDEAHRWFGSNANLYAIPSDAPEWVERVADQGCEIAYRTGKVWKPSHAAALRRSGPLRSQQAIDVDATQARSYLAGSPIPCTLRGWSVVRLHGRPLGWIKSDGRTGKNHLPAASRFANLDSGR